MELWQVAVLLDRHHIEKPQIPEEPDDWEDRVEKYREVIDQRREKRQAAMKKKVQT